MMSPPTKSTRTNFLATMERRPTSPLAKRLPPLVLGGAGFSNQCHPSPTQLPVAQVIKQAFDSGVRAIDTSPYYEPSEGLIGKALQSSEITSTYQREDYILMTKVGRIAAEEFNYSRSWVRNSVERSLKRFETTYLDVVFCHDIEYVNPSDVLEAVGELLEFVKEGKVKWVGVSSYRIDLLVQASRLVLERFGRPLDIVQNWGQLNLQNTRLAREGLSELEKASVGVVLNASPLNIGLLRAEGVPVGQLGDFHPAPRGLRTVVKDIADYVAGKGENLAALALRYCLWQAEVLSSNALRVATITGISTPEQLGENLGAASILLKNEDGAKEGLLGRKVDEQQLAHDRPLYDEAQRILRESGWMEYGFTSPDPLWDTETKKMRQS